MNHSAAKHRIAIRPNNRRTPSRLAANEAPDGEVIEDPKQIEEERKPLTRSASMSSLDFCQIQEAQALLKTKSHSFKALPALFLLDNVDIKQSTLSPNVIMVRTLPAMKIITDEEQQEKFRLSIANWCLANEGLRKSIQSLQKPVQPLSLCVSSESLASICSGLQALDSGVADITEISDDSEELMEQDSSSPGSSQDSNSDQDPISIIEQASIEDVIDEIIQEEEDGLMNVNVKERRQCLMQMISSQVLKSSGSLDSKTTMSRLAAKNAAVVKMAVQNLNNLNKMDKKKKVEPESILEVIEANSKVKLMVSKFDNQN